ncbi:DUF3102 domain-containing protein [Mycobacterium paragordonae]|uniref:DUF3102 domain-containing protein n=1 Tax=Mycobacterium paragordonae TaxID=1389713 RepID=UPI0012E30845|nr:DUF3102 domain-containing protein [Mycobacterium paragordonae]
MTDLVVSEDLSGASLPALARHINSWHLKCEEGKRTALEAAWHAGTALIEAKSRCKHGEWLEWLKSNFAGSHDTAAAYMKIANFEHARNLDSQTSIRQAMAIICEYNTTAKPQRNSSRRNASPVQNTFAGKFYHHISKITEHAMAIQVMINNDNFVKHRDLLWRNHHDDIEWATEILERTLDEINRDHRAIENAAD